MTDNLSELFGLSIDELEELQAFNNTDCPFSNASLIDDLIFSLDTDHSREACIFESRHLRRGALLQETERLACALQALGIKRHQVVAIALPPCPERLMAVLAVLRCGAAFLPLDPAQPAERLRFQLEDSHVQLLLTDETFPATGAGVSTLLLQELKAPEGAVFRPDSSRLATDWAYIIYTSGSTGQPKAAANTHRALVNRLQWMEKFLSVTAADRICHKTAFGFDVSVWEQLLPLLTGACVVIAPGHFRGDPDALAALIKQAEVSIIHFVPTMLSAFLESEAAAGCVSLRAVVASGEALPKSVAQACCQQLGVPVHNLYGPTEAAIDVTAWTFDPADGRAFVPIGKPIQNVQVHVLDTALERVPVGGAGELYIGGEAVGDGYLYRPGLTAARFLPAPFSTVPGKRMYRTGDIVRLHEGGIIEFIGRADHQVKIRGFRIETGEVEEALRRFPAVAQAAVIAYAAGTGMQQLAAYVVGKDGQAPDMAPLKAHLQQYLPVYMLPSVIIPLPALPVTPNGKLDREALPLPSAGGEMEADAILPGTENERILAAIWRHLLKCEVNNVKANFFSLGGDSIVAIRVVIQAGKKGLQIQVKDLFDHPTLQALAAAAKGTAAQQHTAGSLSPLAAAWKTAGEESRAAAAPVMMYEVEAQQRPFLEQRLERLSGMLAESGPAARFSIHELPSREPVAAARQLVEIIGRDSALSFAAAFLESDMPGKALLVIAFDPALADSYSLQQLPFLLLAETDSSPWFLSDQPPAAAFEENLLQKAAPPQVRSLPEIRMRKETLLLKDVFPVSDDNIIGRERCCEALVVRTAGLILEKAAISRLQVLLPESRTALINNGYATRRLFGRLAMTFSWQAAKDQLEHMHSMVREVARLRAGKGAVTAPVSGFRFRVLIIENNDQPWPVPGIHTAAVASAAAGAQELLLVIGPDRLEWRWDEEIGHWPAAVIAALQDELSNSHWLSSVAAIRVETDFSLAGLGNRELEAMNGSLAAAVDLYPLAPLQEGLLLRSVYWPGSDAYLNQNVIELRGDLDIDCLVRAWDVTVKRYEILRSGFLWEGLPAPLQFVADSPVRKLELQDWRDRISHPGAVDQLLKDFLAADRQLLFNMSEAGLFRLVLAKTSERTHLLVWTHHHILLDGWCLALIWGDVFRCYESFAGKAPAVYLPSRPYRDYIAWLAQYPSGEKDGAFWRHTLAGFGAPAFFSPKPADVEGEFRTDRLLLDHAKLEKLKKAAAQDGVTVNIYVQTAWALLLGLRTGRNDVVHGVSVSGRPPALADAENIVGLFINTIPLRSDLHPRQALRTLIRRTQEKFAAANDHSTLPLAAILSQWEGRAAADKRLFDSLIAFENYPDERLPASKVADIEIRDLFCNEKTEYPIGLIVLPGPPMEFHFNYDCSHFEPAEADRIARDFFYLLDSLVDNPEMEIASLLLPSAKAGITAVMAGPPLPPGNLRPLSAEILQLAEQASLQIALIAGGRNISYGQLGDAVQAAASQMALQAAGKKIGICMERSAAFVVAVLGAWEAGLAPLIINPALPDSMIGTVLEQAGHPAMAVTPLQQSRMASLGCAAFIIDAFAGRVAPAPEAGRPVAGPVAAILLTSGSTGAPKQVMVTWQGLSARIRATVRKYNMHQPCLLANAAPGFDIGLWEMLFTLVQGGTLVLAGDEDMKDPAAICALISRFKVNALHVVPSFGEILLACSKRELMCIRLLVTGGEVVQPAYVERLRAKMPVAEIWQAYGPTEASVSVLDHHCNGESLYEERIPLGSPSDACAVYLLDEALRPVPIGAAGTIYIGGEALAAGYLGNPRKTAASFLPDPFGAPGARCYCTGDMGLLGPDGRIRFLGRADRQVKIRGFRVEPALVEHQLTAHPLVLQAAVTAQATAEGEVQLLAFITTTLDAGQATDISALLSGWLAERLPVWACPSRIYPVSNFPLTANGKVDMERLLAERPAPATDTAATAALSPQEQVIYEVWEEILGAPPAGRQAHFFMAGGHSLSAMRFALLLQRRLGAEAKVPVSLLFKYPSPAALSEAIVSSAAVSGGRWINTISEGEGPALVLVHPVEGTAVAYGILPELLPGRKIMVIDNPRFDAAKGFSSLREMAALYLEWIRILTDDGPVLLGGWSFGGVVALEIARQMSRHGHMPDGVIMLDSYNLAGRIDLHASSVAVEDRIRLRAGTVEPALMEALIKEIHRNQLLALSAPPISYNGPVWLVKAAERDAAADKDLGADNGWTTGRLPGLKVLSIPGHHHGMFDRRNADSLAEIFRSFIHQTGNNGA